MKEQSQSHETTKTHKTRKRYKQKDPTRKFLTKNRTKSSFLRWQQHQQEV